MLLPVQWLQRKWSFNYEGAVHLFAGSPASTANVDRLKGFEEYMAANCPKIKVLGTLYSEADINLCTTHCGCVVC